MQVGSTTEIAIPAGAPGADCFFPMNCIFVVNKSLRTCFLRMSTNIIDMQAAAEEAEKELEARHLTFRQRVCMIKVKQHFLGEETP